MKIRFSNPCDANIVKIRTIPNKGQSKKVKYYEDSITWEFTQWGYNYCFKYINGKASLLVTGGNIYDCYDWNKTDVELITSY